MITYRGKNIDGYKTENYPIDCPFGDNAVGKLWADIVYCDNKDCRRGCAWKPEENVPIFEEVKQ
jgi:hypothetical protein